MRRIRPYEAFLGSVAVAVAVAIAVAVVFAVAVAVAVAAWSCGFRHNVG